MGEIHNSLRKFLNGLKLILIKFDRFLETLNIDLLNEIANDFINLGNSLYAEFGSISHRVLCVTALEAGLKLRERYQELQSRSINSRDLEYFNDVYNIFKYIANKIESGEYEEELIKMKKSREKW